MKIVFWLRLPFARDLVIEHFSKEPGIDFVVCPTLDDCIAAMPGTDGIVLYNCKPADAKLFMDGVAARADQLRWMHFLTAGVEGFDAVGFPKGVTVTQTHGASAPVVAEHALALLLALARRVPELVEQQQRRVWDRGLGVRMSTLEGRTLAVVGYSAIGREAAKRARAFGMRIVAVSRGGAQGEHADEGRRLADLHAVLAEADAVLIAIALTAETRHLMNAAAFAALKPGAWLVNVSRGGVVDQVALAEALRSGRLAGAGLDVTAPEPLPADDPLWQSPNLLVSPHIAVEGSRPTEERMANGALATLRRFVRGEALS